MKIKYFKIIIFTIAIFLSIFSIFAKNEEINLKITKVTSQENFKRSKRNPLQVIKVVIVNMGEKEAKNVLVFINSPEINYSTKENIKSIEPKNKTIAEVGIEFSDKVKSEEEIEVDVILEYKNKQEVKKANITKKEGKYKLWFIPGFHYDPVWWNTQANYVEFDKHSAFNLIKQYLNICRKDPDYKFVLEQIPYLKPYWDSYPEDRDFIRKLIKEGRLEIVGGTYNQLQSTLISGEAMIRNGIYGMNYQKNVIGGNPKVNWQCDVFGHNPNFPQLMKKLGHQGSSWGRGPFHQWGADRAKVNFPSEFYWMAPSGDKILTHYMTGHYGYAYDKIENVGENTDKAIVKMFEDLKRPAATPNIFLQLSNDFCPPKLKLGEIVRAWNKKNVYPELAIGTPSEVFSAIENYLKDNDIRLPDITRDMNPIYTGCEVSYIDTKIANRACENTLTTAEKFSTVANILGAEYPSLLLDKAWRQLLFTSHHDAITGSESDQTYIDLTGIFRESYEISKNVLDESLKFIIDKINTENKNFSDCIPLVVFNPLSWERTDVAEIEFEEKEKYKLFDCDGKKVPSQKYLDKLIFIAENIPAMGYKVYYLSEEEGKEILQELKSKILENEYFKITLSPERGGGIISIIDKKTGKEFVKKGEISNDLVAYKEYNYLPGHGEGPWHLAPTGVKKFLSSYPAKVKIIKGGVMTKAIIKPLLPSISIDPFITVLKYDKKEREMKNRKVHRIDITKYLKDTDTIYLKFEDADKSDGWGPSVYNVEVKGDINLKITSVGDELERKYIYEDSQSNIDKDHRFADMSNYWIYKIPLEKNIKAVIYIDIANEYLVKISNIPPYDFPPCRVEQEITLYNKVKRIDFNSYISSYQGSDWLFKLHFPVDTKGARPVFEVANASIARPFGFDVDTKKFSWTLDNACYNFVDYSIPLKIKVKDKDKIIAAKSIGVGEIVIGKNLKNIEEEKIYSLVKALAQKGITTTVTRDNQRRYGDISIDSNLPDFRISVGSKEENSYTKQILEKIKLGENLPEIFYLESSDELPILFITKNIEKNIERLIEGIEDGEITLLENEFFGKKELLEDYGVALINTGTPSCNIYPGGTITMSVMRSCTGWPSGVWINQPKRSMPDGSNFQLMHWNHKFSYSLYPHQDNWRGGKVYKMGYEVNFPLIVKITEPHSGELPEKLSFIKIEPDDLVLTVMKPSGYPFSDYSYPEIKEDVKSGITLRIYDAEGREKEGIINFFKDISLFYKSNILEKEKIKTDQNGKNIKIKIPAFSTETFVFNLKEEPKDKIKLIEEKEISQPIYVKYWRYNEGEAPLGNSPLNIFIEPAEISQEVGNFNHNFKIKISSSFKSNLEGKIEFILPRNWKVKPKEINYEIKPAEFKIFNINVSTKNVISGTYYLYVKTTECVSQQEIFDVAKIMTEKKYLSGKWKFKNDDKKIYSEENFKDKDWSFINVPGYWETQGYPNYDGIGWYRKEFSLKEDLIKEKFKLVFEGGVDDNCEIYMNGKLITSRVSGLLGHQANKEFSLEIPEGILKNKNIIAIRVQDTGGDGGINGKISLINSKFLENEIEYSVEKEIIAKRGEEKEIDVVLKNLSPQVIFGKVQLCTPYEMYEKISPFITPFNISPAGEEKIKLNLKIPMDEKAGNYYVLLKIMYADKILYSEPTNINIVE